MQLGLLKSTLCYYFLSPAARLVIFWKSLGYVLPVGVGGSGKQSLSRLAAYIYSMEIFQITLKKDYEIQDLRVN